MGLNFGVKIIFWVENIIIIPTFDVRNRNLQRKHTFLVHHNIAKSIGCSGEEKSF